MDGRKNNGGKKGNKGGTGRPTLVNELVRSAVLNKSWQVLLDILEDKDVEFDTLKEIALKLCPRNIPQNLDMQSGGEPFKIIIERYGGESKQDKTA